jgi:hypothetical protein
MDLFRVAGCITALTRNGIRAAEIPGEFKK